MPQGGRTGDASPPKKPNRRLVSDMSVLERVAEFERLRLAHKPANITNSSDSESSHEDDGPAHEHEKSLQHVTESRTLESLGPLPLAHDISHTDQSALRRASALAARARVPRLRLGNKAEKASLLEHSAGAPLSQVEVDGPSSVVLGDDSPHSDGCDIGRGDIEVPKTGATNKGEPGYGNGNMADREPEVVPSLRDLAAGTNSPRQRRTTDSASDACQSARLRRASTRLSALLAEEKEDWWDSALNAIPFFICIQIVVVVGLWAKSYHFHGEARGGLDMLLPEQGLSDLKVSTDCTNHQMEVWRWFTYQYTHISCVHLLCCSLTLLFGIPLERQFGTLRLFVIFNAGVVGGALHFFTSNIHRTVVGMSGGNYGIFGACVADLLLNWRRKRWTMLQLLMLLLMLSAALAEELVVRSAADCPSPHIGGTVAGFLMGIVVCRSRLENRHWLFLLRMLALCLVGVIASFCILWVQQWPPRNILDGQDTGFCWTKMVINEVSFGDTDWHCVFCQNKTCINSWSDYFLAEPSYECYNGYDL